MHVSINYTDSEGNFVKNLLLDPAEVVAIMNSDIIRLNDDDLKPKLRRHLDGSRLRVEFLFSVLNASALIPSKLENFTNKNHAEALEETRPAALTALRGVRRSFF